MGVFTVKCTYGSVLQYCTKAVVVYSEHLLVSFKQIKSYCNMHHTTW